MGSWWRRYAELIGLTEGHGSWPRRAASLFVPSPTDWEACWWNRTGSALYKRGYDAVALSDVAVASTALTNANFGIGKLGGATSDATGVHRLVAWGKSFSDTNRATVVAALRSYSTAMRALA